MIFCSAPSDSIIAQRPDDTRHEHTGNVKNWETGKLGNVRFSSASSASRCSAPATFEKPNEDRSISNHCFNTRDSRS